MEMLLKRKIAMVLLLAGCVLSTYYFHFILHVDIGIAHLFYIPIVLGGMWWGSQGTIISVFLALLLIGSHILSGIQVPVTHDLMRGVMFILVGYIIGKICTERKRHVRELKSTNELKDLFSDILRHDLMNYMSAIDGASELLEMDESPEDKKEDLEIFREESDNIKKMINDAAVYGKLENPEARGFERRDLINIVEASIETLGEEGREKGIEVVNKIEGEYPVMSNPFLIDVFSNLVSNAVKYSPENSKVFVDVEDSDSFWTVSVRDSGEGISDKYKEDVFRRFQRRSKGGVRGSGLGLAIVKKVVQLHEGNVWVGDNPGGGSIFYVAIPKASHFGHFKISSAQDTHYPEAQRTGGQIKGTNKHRFKATHAFTVQR